MNDFMSVVTIKYHSAILAKIEHEAETELEKELENELDDGKEVKRESESEATGELNKDELSKEGKEKNCWKIQQ